MSYAAGLALGASLGKGIHDLLWTDEHYKRAGGLTIVSDLPGRRRYRAATLTDGLARLLQEKLTQVEYIISCRVNAVSGSILLEFAPADKGKIDNLMTKINERVFGGKARRTPLAATVTPCQGQRVNNNMPVPQAGKLTQNVRRWAGDLSDWLKNVTGGWFDISSLASTFFLIRGLRKTLLTQQMPSGSQMLWWALSLMRGWKTA